MSGVSRDAERRQLEREILQDDHQVLLERLRKQHPLMGGFADWGDVVVFMRQGTSRDPRKDAVLLRIIRAHAQHHDPRWRRILMVVFWPGLEGIWRRKRHWDSDPDALWTNVTWAFLQTVCRLDPSKRSSRLVQKVINDVFHRLHNEYRREWDRTAREVAIDPEVLAGHNVEDEREAAAAALWVEQESRIAILRAHHAAGRIGDADFLLLIGTQVYGRSLGECARESGLSYEAVKKRQQRALRAIGGFPSNET